MFKTLSRALAGAAVVAVALTGCGAGSPSGSGGGAQQGASGSLTKVTVGVLSIAPSSAVQYGIDKGYFAKQGLDVQFQTGQGGAAMLPAVSSGSMDFAVGNPLSVLVATDKGLDMKIVTGFSNSIASGNDIESVVVKKDSPIKTWKDLAGKTVSVNAVNTQGDLTIMESAAKEGADPKAIKFSEVAFPDAQAQLDRGNIDAAWVPEPFMTKMLSNPDYRLLGYPYQVTIPGLPTMVTFTSGNFAKSNPETVQKFQKAMQTTLDAVQKDQQGFKAAAGTFLKIDPAAAQKLNMEQMSADLREQQLTDLGNLMLKYKFVSKQPSVDSILVK
ncbi:NitT/TauT family transport system substrate-binding protein [Sinomonas atrocyanea]|jgi:NitT/TauT family transport system substrate-binding protein|uniref:ABC transporter substrate-binding protein n=1 Tax=Sinomonas atrocyanea TaxID=37927 RepID=UPI0027883B46|nr:ABC transporter substrate-binding protein [Sinomonas atrocyanea]MDQ0259284.1 NitT/TauT family transport system substrate-binding protein [Sinomonas atrocyanea]